MVKFENLDSAKGLGELNAHLQDRSYIEGYVPSQADIEVFKAITSAPDASKAPHVSRWWNHISFFPDSERKAWAASSSASSSSSSTQAAAPAKKDDEFDLFADDEDAEHEREIMRRAKENEEKKKAMGKKKETARSVVIIDVKPWDDTTDLKKVEEKIRAEVTLDGLDWKAAKLVPIGYGIKKLQISCHIVDDLVSVDDIQEKIADLLPDDVQSTDIDSFSKL